MPPAFSDSRKIGGPSPDWNRGHHLVAPLLRGAAVQVGDVAAEARGQVRHQQLGELGELGEAQHPVALGEDLLQDLLEPDDLARPAADGRAIVQQLRRVVAHLLELGHRGQHVAAALDALGVLDLLHHVVDDGLVQRGLLGGELAVLLDLDLLGQVVDDRRVGLDPAQDVGPGDRAQPLGRLGLPVPFDRDRVAGAEPLRGAEQAGVEEVHDRPQLGEPVLHRGPGQRDPVRRPQLAHRLGRPRQAVLHRLRLVEHHPVPLVAGQLVDVAGGRGVGGDDQVGVLEELTQRVAVQPAPPWCAYTRRSGANFAASRCQLPTNDIGHSSRVGPASGSCCR